MNTQAHQDEVRARIAKDTEAYLLSGKRITEVPIHVYKHERLTKDMKKYPIMRGF